MKQLKTLFARLFGKPQPEPVEIAVDSSMLRDLTMHSHLDKANVSYGKRRQSKLLKSVELEDGRISELWLIGVEENPDGSHKSDLGTKLQYRYPDGSVKVVTPY